MLYQINNCSSKQPDRLVVVNIAQVAPYEPTVRTDDSETEVAEETSQYAVVICSDMQCEEGTLN